MDGGTGTPQRRVLRESLSDSAGNAEVVHSDFSGGLFARRDRSKPFPGQGTRPPVAPFNPCVGELLRLAVRLFDETPPDRATRGSRKRVRPGVRPRHAETGERPSEAAAGGRGARQGGPQRGRQGKLLSLARRRAAVEEVRRTLPELSELRSCRVLGQPRAWSGTRYGCETTRRR
jgi:hypothetical protein